MFSEIPLAPADPILGLTDAFKKDPNPQKINLGVGVYKDSTGKTPVLESVKRAEQRLASESQTRSYLPIEGDARYCALVQELVFGSRSEIVSSSRAFTAHAPGGTGALRVTAEFLKLHLPGVKVWLTQPTWPNHPQIFEAAGLEIDVFPWFDPSSNGLDFEGALATLEKIPEGHVVVLHGCCHNPTGIDPDEQQWTAIADVLSRRNLIPIIDFAYQGFGVGISEDAAGLRIVSSKCREFIVCSSFSKNFGLYSERVGAITVVTEDTAAAERIGSQVRRIIRTIYSNPPEHGGAAVVAILADPELRAQWEAEVAQMRHRINHMRDLFVRTLKEKGVKRDFDFIRNQRGMFSFSGLTKEQVQALKETHSIYIVGSGRISVAGMTEMNMDRLCSAIADVIAN